MVAVVADLQSYKGGTYLDCNNRISNYNGKPVSCGFGNDGIEHPAINPTNGDAEVFFGISKSAAGNNIPLC